MKLKETLQKLVDSFKFAMGPVSEENSPYYTPKPTPTPYPEGTVEGDWDFGGLPPNQGYMPRQISTTELAGFNGPQPQQDILAQINTAAQKYGINPNLLAALLFQESSFEPQKVGLSDQNDRGIAQINLKMHPDVSLEQAYNPEFAIPWAADYLKSSLEHFGGNMNRALASYNVGRGGANIKGPTKAGTGPKGQKYIDNVARNLTEELIKELGLIRSE